MQQSTEMTSPATKYIKETFISPFITSFVSVRVYIYLSCLTFVCMVADVPQTKQSSATVNTFVVSCHVWFGYVSLKSLASM